LDAVRLAAQGMATRGVKPSPRSKPSGIPFLARFTDVAETAGLHAPTVYGGVSRKNYIVETMGCGCAFGPAASYSSRLRKNALFRANS
jgi:hypothetical protein